jgi:glycosyltransferase involved in cell wall biosynthesis
MHARHALVVTPYYPPAIGGVEQYAANVVHQLTKRDWRVTVVTTGSQRSGVVIEQTADAVVHRLPSMMKVSNTPVGLGWRRVLRDITRLNRIDVVNVHAPVPWLADVAATAIGDLPLVLTYHTGVMRKQRPIEDATLKTYESVVLPRTARRAQRIICSSGYVQSSFPRLFTGKSSVIQPGVDLERFTMSRPPTTGPLLFVGSLAKATSYKGLADAIHAVAKLRARGLEVHLEVVGDGDARGDYEAVVQSLSLDDDITFRGALSGTDLVTAYQHSRALVLPTHFDSFPTVLVEAMASGRPVVTTPVGGIPDLVSDGISGHLVSPGDVDGLAEAIAAIVTDSVDLASLGQAGRARVASCLSWERQGHLTADVFAQAIEIAAGHRPPRLATVTPYFSPHVGGVESYAKRLSQCVKEQPDFATPIVITAGKARRHIEFTEVDGLPVFALPTWFSISNTPINPTWALQVRRLCRQLGIDAVHGHSPVPGFADLAMVGAGRRRRILTYHSGSMVKHSGHLDRLVTAYERVVLPRLFSRVDDMTVSSPTCLGAATPNARVLSPGVETSMFRPPASGQDRGGILYVGRLERASSWKGVDVLVEAFAQLATTFPETELRLVGGGDLIPDLRHLATSLGIADRVSFLGVRDREALVAEYGRARIVVLPSVTESESFGMSLVEAMACGTPVIGSRVGGIPRVVTHEGNGLLVPPGNICALAGALERLLRDDELARRLGDCGRRTAVREFDWDRTLAKYLDLLRGEGPPRRVLQTSSAKAHWRRGSSQSTGVGSVST